MEIIFHYPPELLNLLIEAIPKLCRSKKDLLLFFQGAGVSKTILDPQRRLLLENKEGFNKYQVTRDVLRQLNELGERSLRERREILKRVTDFHDFSVCWESDQAVARGLVSQIRDLVNVKDSFTRMNMEREREQTLRRVAQEERMTAEIERRKKCQQIKGDLFALFGEPDAHKRGKALEQVLGELFAAFGIRVREAFGVKGLCGEGVIEQIDGLIELEGHLYLVELKWWNAPLGTSEISPHLVRVFGRGGQARGIFISYSDYTSSAIATCREAIAAGSVVILCKLQEIVQLLEHDKDLRQWLKDKLVKAVADKNPLYVSET
jgi:hypothetical protein